MEFHEKLQVLRKDKGLTQEELAQQLFVSRAAISKWESGRGYPNIDSLKALSVFFAVSIDDLLSGDEVLTLAEEDGRQKRKHLCDLVFGCLDCSFTMFFFLPIFGQTGSGSILSVALPALSLQQNWLKTLFLISVTAMIILGMLTLTLQTGENLFWSKRKGGLSLLGNLAVTFLFILSRQPYAAAFALFFFLIKILILLKKQ